jgi:hypothetical protein
LRENNDAKEFIGVLILFFVSAGIFYCWLLFLDLYSDLKSKEVDSPQTQMDPEFEKRKKLEY